MNKTYIKSIFADMKKTKGKVLSIMIMVALASLVVVGLLLSGPSMRKSLNNSLGEYKHPDLIVRSTYGLDFEDQALIKKEEGIDKINFIKATDLRIGEDIIRLKEYDSEIPKSVITEGKIPSKDDEIILDENLKDKYKIGDELSFSYINDEQKDDQKMANLRYKLVGFYKSSDYFMEDMKEISPLGKSEIAGFAYALPNNFLSDKYHEANIVYKDLLNLDRTSSAYIEKINSKKDELTDRIKNRPDQVLNKIRKDADDEITDAEKDITNAEEKLSDNEKKLIESKNDLDEGFRKYDANKSEFNQEIAKGEKDLAKAKNDLNQGRERLEVGKREYQASLETYENEITKAEEELDKKRKDLNLGLAQIDGPKKEMDKAYEELNEKFESSFNKLEEAEASLILEENYINSKKQELEEAESLKDQKDPELIEKIKQLKEEIQTSEASYEAGRIEYDKNKQELDEKYSQAKFELDQKLGSLRAKEDELNKAQAQLDEANRQLANKKSSGKAELDKAYASIKNSENELNQGQRDYENGLAELRRNKLEGKNKLAQAYDELIDGQKKYRDAKEKFDEEKAKASKDIDKAKKDIGDSKESLLTLQDPEYSVESIFDNRGIDTYYQNSLNMDRLSKVFPAFFYLVAMLVTLTTMKRYIEEQRTINGCLKSLGYTNTDIAKRFYIYGISPTIIGALLGAVIGRFVILKVIFTAYSTGFKVLSMEVINSFPALLISVLVSTFLIAFTVFISSKETVKEVPANLLKAKAPDAGSKIFLERIKFLWKRLSFMAKITSRNLFRYKSRMFMTIFGVGGCTALLFFGFAMIDAIKDTSRIQQEEIQHYSLVSMINTKAKKEELVNYKKLVANYDNINVYNESASLQRNGEKLDLSIIVPENDEKLKDFVSLRDKHRNPIDLTSRNVVITENIAKKLGIKKGDRLKFEIGGENTEVILGDISENYISDYMYISRKYYIDNIGKDLVYNSNLIKADPREIKDKIDDNKAVNALINKTGAYESMDALLANLNLVISVITLISSALAIVVLYNITSINVGERKRELATIKVLGFYSKEVTSYIYREIFILTILGIVVGFFLGYAMFRYIIGVVAPEDIMIAYRTHIISYLISAAITLVISLVILIFVHKDLKRIDMAEAMSSGE